MSVGGNIGGLLHAACSNGAATVTFTVPANTIKNSRTVTFEYLWNGTWTKIGSDCTQQPCYYVSSAAVTPRGDIPAVGGTYTVTLEGYGSFQIRAVDGNGVQLIISTEKNACWNYSANINIPENNEYASREVIIGYESAENWTEVARLSQAFYPAYITRDRLQYNQCV